MQPCRSDQLCCDQGEAGVVGTYVMWLDWPNDSSRAQTHSLDHSRSGDGTEMWTGLILLVSSCVTLWPWKCRSAFLSLSPHLLGLRRWLSGKESACQCRRCGFYPWVRKIRWRRAWQPTPVSLPGKSHGQRSLVGHSPWGHKEMDTHFILWDAVGTDISRALLSVPEGGWEVSALGLVIWVSATRAKAGLGTLRPRATGCLPITSPRDALRSWRKLSVPSPCSRALLNEGRNVRLSLQETALPLGLAVIERAALFPGCGLGQCRRTIGELLRGSER